MTNRNPNPDNEAFSPDPEEIRHCYPIENDADTLEPFDDKQESREINPEDPAEMAYWTQQFQISESQLHDAVALKGTSVRAIKKYLSI
ncbi:DUF3606 domain-containing protein [Pedobacter aquatilis]|uniref:DUF3606 domain-containing protein n=1 Tax=Pedobacter aquatilis TaxID=351343 RepID=UPI002930A1CD|nr:DUF3606 domain-containing protein [Pedobacter aquatilis]